MYSLLNEHCSRMRVLYSPTTDRLLWRNMPPS